MTSYQAPGVSAHELEYMRDKTFVWQVDAPPALLSDEDMRVVSIAGTLTLRREVNMVRYIGKLNARVELTSDRTLENYETDLDIEFEDGIEVVTHHHLVEQTEFTSEDAVDSVTPEENINLLELLRQYLILNLPMQKLESENCYNEELSKYARDPAADAGDDIDPAWQAIRDKVKSWEKPSDN